MYVKHETGIRALLTWLGGEPCGKAPTVWLCGRPSSDVEQASYDSPTADVGAGDSPPPAARRLLLEVLAGHQGKC